MVRRGDGGAYEGDRNAPGAPPLRAQPLVATGVRNLRPRTLEPRERFACGDGVGVASFSSGRRGTATAAARWPPALAQCHRAAARGDAAASQTSRARARTPDRAGSPTGRAIRVRGAPHAPA